MNDRSQLDSTWMTTVPGDECSGISAMYVSFSKMGMWSLSSVTYTITSTVLSQFLDLMRNSLYLETNLLRPFEIYEGWILDADRKSGRVFGYGRRNFER